MSKKTGSAGVEAASTGKGRIVMFDIDGVPTKRVDYIRDRYYGDNGIHEEGDPSRSDILKEVRELQADDSVAYQIVFAATKTPERPVAKPRSKKAADEDVAEA